jgi:hypothetical protein
MTNKTSARDIREKSFVFSSPGDGATPLSSAGCLFDNVTTVSCFFHLLLRHYSRALFQSHGIFSLVPRITISARIDAFIIEYTYIYIENTQEKMNRAE